MGLDTFCAVSGARYFWSREEFRDDILQCCQYWEDSEEGKAEGKGRLQEISDTIRSGLCYSDEDVASSSKYVLLCQYDTLEDGSVHLHTEFEGPISRKYTESNITLVYDVIPGDDPELGDYHDEHVNPDDPDSTLYSVFGCTFLIAYTSFLILKQAAPNVEPHVMYTLAYDTDAETQGWIHGVDYGPVTWIMGQYAYWPAICRSSEHSEPNSDYDEPGKVWTNLLTQKGKTDEEILRDAWRGPGNMWVFVRPDRFPIAETLAASPLPTFSCDQQFEKNHNEPPSFESLPLDIILSICKEAPIRTIYALISTSKHLRSLILPHADVIARHRLIEDEPWYLPAGPFELRDKKHGREEIDYWKAQWAASGISGEEMDTKIPWFLYRRHCSSSMSMWNRKRIWGVAKQLEQLAQERGLL